MPPHFKCLLTASKTAGKHNTGSQREWTLEKHCWGKKMQIHIFFFAFPFNKIYIYIFFLSPPCIFYVFLAYILYYLSIYFTGSWSVSKEAPWMDGLCIIIFFIQIINFLYMIYRIVQNFPCNNWLPFKLLVWIWIKLAIPYMILNWILNQTWRRIYWIVIKKEKEKQCIVGKISVMSSLFH